MLQALFVDARIRMSSPGMKKSARSCLEASGASEPAP